MIFEEIIKLLESNRICNLSELKKTLLEVAAAIFNCPNNNAALILPKKGLLMPQILSLNGGKLMLLHMGFMEKENSFEFPMKNRTKSGDVLLLNRLKNIHEKLLEWEPVPRSCCDEEVQEITRNIGSLPLLDTRAITLHCSEPFVKRYNNPFLHKISVHFYNAQKYNNATVKQNARKLIPVTKLEINIQNKVRSMQRLSKQGRFDDSLIVISDLLLIELLRWFKEEFFTWMNSPICKNCDRATTFSHYSSDINEMRNADKVEVFICEGCWELVSFRRFHDLNILLETRTGRCGEWADVFTLMCRCMGFDSRIVFDETDHVWTEVYSPFRKQWIHCDPCENVYDTPLMYEQGWGKSLSYVMAYSPYELQDVTWRYSSQHQNVLKRRKKCSEQDLINAIVELRNDRLMKCTPVKRMYILKRCTQELVELLQERRPKDIEMRGRSSGELSWRLARGETTETSYTPFTFNISSNAPTSTTSKNTYNIKYSCASDKYIIYGDEVNSFNSWHRGVYSQSNIMRKEEHDWKQVYLCRTESAKTGYIAWNFKLIKSRIIRMRLRMLRKVFENGVVTVKLTDGILETDDFDGCTSLLIEACLTGGLGNEAWQHAQLFRQPFCSEDSAFELEIEHS
ncbi:hypothetical protein WA026_017929 [Henosepilachna vigintioctopunctata]|uniref:Peptide-N(4)-(N-acetyl-beta-glucosaminyl)asparagine amidase n=1 Tax=Henosepilachna vigintioctopunctata TaxID=420089 RepID=A0AAW1TXN4_9CUCU